MNQFSEEFKEELGVLQDIEANVEVVPTAQPCFCKSHPTTICFEGELSNY